MGDWEKGAFSGQRSDDGVRPRVVGSSMLGHGRRGSIREDRRQGRLRH